MQQEQADKAERKRLAALRVETERKAQFEAEVQARVAAAMAARDIAPPLSLGSPAFVLPLTPLAPLSSNPNFSSISSSSFGPRLADGVSTASQRALGLANEAAQQYQRESSECYGRRSAANEFAIESLFRIAAEIR